MTADRHRCRWHTDGPSGRCPGPQAFPGVTDVPELCTEHLRALEGWITARAAQRAAGDGPAWIEWARRRAAGADADRRASGALPPRGEPLILRRRVTGTAGT